MRLQFLGRERASEVLDIAFAAPRGEALAGAQRLGLGHVVPGEARQECKQIARERAEEALDEGLALGRIGRANVVVDLKIGQHAEQVARGVILALVGAHRLRHAPIDNAAAEQGGDRRGPAGRHHQHAAAPAPHVDGDDHGIALAVVADHVGRRAVELPLLIEALDMGGRVAARRLAVRAVAVGIGDGAQIAGVLPLVASQKASHGGQRRRAVRRSPNW